MLVDLPAQMGDLLTGLAEVLGLDARGFFLLAKSLVHGQETLGILTLRLVYGCKLITKGGYL